MENINKTIHGKMGGCWHESNDTDRATITCSKCGNRFGGGLWASVNPKYDSPDSPRSLLDGAVAKAIERFGPGAVGKKLARILETDGTTERLGELDAIATAPPDAICRAILALYSESEGEEK